MSGKLGLACLAYSNWKMIMVQLVTDGGTKYYKVMLVCGDDLRFNTYAAHSKTGAWSWMESGLIFGDGHRSFVHNEVNDRRVFDCTTKTMYQFVSRGPGQPINRLRSHTKMGKPTTGGFRFQSMHCEATYPLCMSSKGAIEKFYQVMAIFCVLRAEVLFFLLGGLRWREHSSASAR